MPVDSAANDAGSGQFGTASAGVASGQFQPGGAAVMARAAGKSERQVASIVQLDAQLITTLGCSEQGAAGHVGVPAPAAWASSSG